MATAEDLLRIKEEMDREDEALMRAGYAPGEEADPEDPILQQTRADMIFETLPEAEMDLGTRDVPEFVDPFTEFDDPFRDLDEREELITNPLETFPSEPPMEPGTSRASLEMGEMFVPPMFPEKITVPAGVSQIPGEGIDIPVPKFLSQIGRAERVSKGRTSPETGMGVGATLPPEDAAMIASAAMTMTDPEEIAEMLRNYPEDIAIQYAPDGAIIATNVKTGARGLINRPGFSAMDVLQMLGIGSLLAPASGFARAGVQTAVPKVASATMRQQISREAAKQGAKRFALAAGATQAGIEAGQTAAGGTFDPNEILFTAGTGYLGERAEYPLAMAASKAKEFVGPLAETVPRGIMQALDYAEQTGRKIFTSDALSDFMTPVQKIALKGVERIPITGIGRARTKQKAARANAIVDLVNKYGIDLETEFGQDIADNFITRMIRQRFWGKNKEVMDPNNWPSPVTRPKEYKAAKARAQELLERAYSREADEVVDQAIAKQLRQGNLDDEIVERVLDQGVPKRVRDLFGRLMPDGQLSVKQRFFQKGLEKSGWSNDNPMVGDPDKLVDYLSDAKNKKVMNIIFDADEKRLIEGAREYLRLTAEAGKVGEGAGMVAAVGGSTAVAAALLNGLFGLAAATAVSGRVIQGGAIRNALLKLTYAKGDMEKTQQIMQTLRPLVAAATSQYMESGGPPQLPDIEFNKDMMKQLGDYGMEYLRTVGESSMKGIEDASQALGRMLTPDNPEE